MSSLLLLVWKQASKLDLPKACNSSFCLWMMSTTRAKSSSVTGRSATSPAHISICKFSSCASCSAVRHFFFPIEEISYKFQVFVLIALIDLETSLQTGFTQGLQLIFLFVNDVHDTSKKFIGDGPQRHVTGTYLHLQILKLCFLFCSKTFFFPIEEISYKFQVFVLIALIDLETSLQTGFTQGLQLIFLFVNDVHDTSKKFIGDGPQRHVTGTYLHLQILKLCFLFCSKTIFFRLKKFLTNFKSLSSLLLLVWKQASKLDLPKACNSSFCLWMMSTTRAKSSSVTGRSATSPAHISICKFSSCASCSAVRQFFFRLKKFLTNFKSLSSLLLLVWKQASKLDLPKACNSSLRLWMMSSKRTNSGSFSILHSFASQNSICSFWPESRLGSSLQYTL